MVNGKSQEVAEEETVMTLLDRFQLAPQTVAVELNLEIVPKKEYDKIVLKEDDKIEIISFVGGG
jgi:sulfur carrier protein